MHLRYSRRLIDDLDGVNVSRRSPQASDAPETGFGGFTGPVTITIISTFSNTATPPPLPVPPPPPNTILGIPTAAPSNTILGIPTVTHSVNTPSVSPTVLPTSSAGSSAQPTTPPFQSIGLTTLSQTSIRASSTASPSQTGNAEGAGAGRASSKLSSGGIAAIVFALVIVAFCVVFFIMRRRSRNLRERKRSSWLQNKTVSPVMTTISPVTALSPLMRNGSGYSRTTRSAENGPTPAVSFVEYPPPVPGLLTVRNGAPTPSISTVAPPPRISVPSTSYNNSNADASTIGSTSSGRSQSTGGAVAAPATGTGIGTVICTYITSLPDELPIRIGEIIRVVAEYDDGWGLCTNTAGEQGMVPLECLQMGPTPKRPTGSEFDSRRSRRASSLMPQ
ncbi:hypothetical protein D9619_005284 [Psilocybe cf. subviscida]|uniref:SH3 domain-containing protein n=1 Tax=Psilocybe cf. subviscida TaxID=2480587 RepID=A0A8H5BWJ9_9AGAR|nr:hypothetical protein D9619_005284 [Psilocybe cf. subviscida]